MALTTVDIFSENNSPEASGLGARALRENEKLAHGAFETLKLFETWRSSRSQTAKYFKYVAGDSWEKSIYDALVAQGVTPLSINKLVVRLVRIYGYILENTGRYQAFPLENATMEDAVVATKLLEEVDVDGDFTNASVDAYIDASVGMMGGWIEAYLYDNGTPCIERLPSFNVLPDPSVPFSKQSRKARRITKVDWMSTEEIIEKWPEKEDEIMAVVEVQTGATDFFSETGNFWSTIDGPDVNLQEELFNRKENLYRVIEMYYRKIIPVYSVELPGIGDIGPLTKAVAQAVSDRLGGGLRIRRSMKKVTMKQIMMADLVMLHEEVLDVQNDQFPIFGMGYYEFSGFSFSLVKVLAPLIDEINQSRTTMNVALHTSGMPWLHSKKGSLSPEMKRRLEKYRGVAGLHVESEPGFPDPYIMPGGEVNVGQYRRMEMADSNLDEISGVDQTSIAQQGKNEPLGTTLLRNENLGRVLKMSLENRKRMTTEAARYLIDIARANGSMMSFQHSDGNVVQIDGSRFEGKEIGVKLMEVDKSQTRKQVEFNEMSSFVSQFIPPQSFPAIVPILINATNWEHDTKQALLQAVDQQNQDKLGPEQQTALQNMLTASKMGQI